MLRHNIEIFQLINFRINNDTVLFKKIKGGRFACISED